MNNETLLELMRHARPGAGIATNFVLEAPQGIATTVAIRAGEAKRGHYLHCLGDSYERQWAKRWQS